MCVCVRVCVCMYCVHMLVYECVVRGLVCCVVYAECVCMHALPGHVFNVDAVCVRMYVHGCVALL